MTPRQEFIAAYRQEHETTLRVLRAYPEGQDALRPHSACKTAKELAWTFVAEQGLCKVALTTGFDWSKPLPLPRTPERLQDIVTLFEEGREQLTGLVAARDAELTGTVQFLTAPNAITDVPLARFMWMMLCDQIHHRGQFSIYLRMAGGRVPSIDGSNAGELWH